MGVEIERKFLVVGETWRDHVTAGRKIRQGYLARDGNTVRVRRTEDRAVLTVKGPGLVSPGESTSMKFPWPRPMSFSHTSA